MSWFWSKVKVTDGFYPQLTNSHANYIKIDFIPCVYIYIPLLYIYYVNSNFVILVLEMIKIRYIEKLCVTRTFDPNKTCCAELITTAFINRHTVRNMEKYQYTTLYSDQTQKTPQSLCITVHCILWTQLFGSVLSGTVWDPSPASPSLPREQRCCGTLRWLNHT